MESSMCQEASLLWRMTLFPNNHYLLLPRVLTHFRGSRSIDGLARPGLLSWIRVKDMVRPLHYHLLKWSRSNSKEWYIFGKLNSFSASPSDLILLIWMVVDLLFPLDVEQQLTIHILMWTYIRGGQYVNWVAAIDIFQTNEMDRLSSYPVRNCLMTSINMAPIVSNSYPEVNIFYSVPSTLTPHVTNNAIPIPFIFKNIRKYSFWQTCNFILSNKWFLVRCSKSISLQTVISRHVQC